MTIDYHVEKQDDFFSELHNRSLACGMDNFFGLSARFRWALPPWHFIGFHRISQGFLPDFPTLLPASLLRTCLKVGGSVSSQLLFVAETIWVFPKIGVSQNGWFMMENPSKMDDLGVPLFSETSI